MKLANLSLSTELYGFALPIDSSLLHELNIELLRMHEEGHVQGILDRWLHSTEAAREILRGVADDREAGSKLAKYFANLGKENAVIFY